MSVQEIHGMSGVYCISGGRWGTRGKDHGVDKGIILGKTGTGHGTLTARREAAGSAVVLESATGLLRETRGVEQEGLHQGSGGRRKGGTGIGRRTSREKNGSQKYMHEYRGWGMQWG